MKKLFFICIVTALMMTSCSSSLNESVTSGSVGVSVQTDPAKAEYAIGGKISGEASATYLFGMIPLNEPTEFADGISGFGGFGASGKVKSAAAFNAMDAANADMIINPQYSIEMNKNLFTTNYTARVTGWAGNITSIK